MIKNYYEGSGTIIPFDKVMIVSTQNHAVYVCFGIGEEDFIKLDKAEGALFVNDYLDWLENDG